MIGHIDSVCVCVICTEKNISSDMKISESLEQLLAHWYGSSFYEMYQIRHHSHKSNTLGLLQRSGSHTHHTYTICYCLCGKLKSVRIASHSLNFVSFCHSFSICPMHMCTHTCTIFIRAYPSYSHSYPYSNHLMSFDCLVKPDKTHQACSTHKDPKPTFYYHGYIPLTLK